MYVAIAIINGLSIMVKSAIPKISQLSKGVVWLNSTCLFIKLFYYLVQCESLRTYT